MKTTILVAIATILSAGLLVGCGEGPIKDDVTVGYTTVNEPGWAVGKVQPGHPRV